MQGNKHTAAHTHNHTLVRLSVNIQMHRSTLSIISLSNILLRPYYTIFFLPCSPFRSAVTSTAPNWSGFSLRKPGGVGAPPLTKNLFLKCHSVDRFIFSFFSPPVWLCIGVNLWISFHLLSTGEQCVLRRRTACA